jgi:hypothetical protein
MLPPGRDIYIRLDIAGNKDIVAKALKDSGNSSLSGIVNYAESAYVAIGLGEEAEIDAILVGAYPEGMLRDSIKGSKELVKNGPFMRDPLTGLTIDLPVGYAIALSKGGMAELAARIKAGAGGGERIETPSGAAMSFSFPEAGKRILAKILPDLELEVADGWMAIKSEKGRFTLEGSFSCGSAQGARMLAPLMRAAFSGIGDMLSPGAEVLFQGAKPRSDGLSVSFKGQELGPEALSAFLGSLLAPNNAGA